MNATELTKIVNEHSDIISELKTQVKYLTQEIEHQRLIIDDLKIDVKMLQEARAK